MDATKLSPLGQILIPDTLASVINQVVNVAGKTPFDIYIGRSSRGRADLGWGNPAQIRSNSTKARLEAVTAFYSSLTNRYDLMERLPELMGSTLGCWCSPKLCHGHILAALSDPELRNEVHTWVQTLTRQHQALPMRVLLTGSRSWTDADSIKSSFAKWWSNNPSILKPVLVVGDAVGADKIAAEIWSSAGLVVERHEAKWDELGKKAGVIRNQSMVDSGVDACLAFPIEDSPGTKHCIAAAKRAGIPTLVHA